MKIKIALLCTLLSATNVYAKDVNLDSMSIIDLYKELEAINYDYEELQKAYEEAKATEQSLANRVLTAASIATTGIGGMELARGLAEQQADKEADANMTAYIESMHCTYGDGKSVPAGPDEIELPGGNDTTLMSLRNEYFALAADLKERKAALGMPPGIESEEILDKSQIALYDDENVGITDGAYASLYRAKALNSETDQAKIDEERNASKNRVIAGGVLTGTGVVGGIIGNSLINGKLGEKIKENKNTKSIENNFKNRLKSVGVENVDKMNLSNIDLNSISDIFDKVDLTGLKGQDATKIFDTSNTDNFMSSFGNFSI